MPITRVDVQNTLKCFVYMVKLSTSRPSMLGITRQGVDLGTATKSSDLPASCRQGDAMDAHDLVARSILKKKPNQP